MIQKQFPKVWGEKKLLHFSFNSSAVDEDKGIEVSGPLLKIAKGLAAPVLVCRQTLTLNTQIKDPLMSGGL